MSSQNLERLRQSANMEAICLLMLQYTFDTRQQEILAISSIGPRGTR